MTKATDGSLAYLVCECCLTLVPPERHQGETNRCFHCFHHEARGIVCKGPRESMTQAAARQRDLLEGYLAAFRKRSVDRE